MRNTCLKISKEKDHLKEVHADSKIQFKYLREAECVICNGIKLQVP
jgi:hypothetical protein